MSGRIHLGVDCGGTSLRVAAADSAGTVLVERSVPTGDAQDRENGLGEAIVAIVADTVAGLGGRRGAVGGIGIGLPFVCWDGRAQLCRNVRALDPAWLEERLGRLYGAPALLTNDVKCAALGESWIGAAKGADPFVYLNIGTGLSSALYADGRVYQGAHRAAGEIAYWITDPAEPGGLADGVGPLEEAMSGVGLSGAYRRASVSAANPAGETVSAEEIFRREGDCDGLASEVIERGLSCLLPAIANLLTFADPELLVIGGGVSRGLASRAGRIEAYVARTTPFPPRIAWSALGGRAGLVGAIRLAMLAGGGEG